MSFWTEFKNFASRGNALDLAVAFVIGVAFSKIISSLVDGIIMPILGLLMGGIDITKKAFTIGQASIKWGAFLQSIIDFIFISFVIFLAIKLLSLLRHESSLLKPAPTPQEKLLTEIRDILRFKKVD